MLAESTIPASKPLPLALDGMLRENIRRAAEILLEEVSTANRAGQIGCTSLPSDAHEALYQATVRMVMRLVVCLFAQSRGLLLEHALTVSDSTVQKVLRQLVEGPVDYANLPTEFIGLIYEGLLGCKLEEVEPGRFSLVRAGNRRRSAGALLHPAAVGGANGPAHSGAALLRQVRRRHPHPEDARVDSPVEGL